MSGPVYVDMCNMKIYIRGGEPFSSDGTFLYSQSFRRWQTVRAQQFFRIGHRPRGPNHALVGSRGKVKVKTRGEFVQTCST